MGYKDDVREYARENPGASAAEIAESLGCARSTVYKWLPDDDEPTDDEPAGETEPEPEPEPDDDGPDLSDPDDEPEELTADDLEDDPDDEPEELDLEDEPGDGYNCGNCGASVEYLQKSCSDCGEKLMWSAIEA